MPQVITTIATWIYTAWTGGYGAVVAFLTKAATAILLNTISSKLLMPKVGTGRLSGMQVMSRTSIDYRKVVYGQAMVSGPIVYNNVQGDSNQNLFFQVALTQGETDSFVSIWLDGDEIPVADINWTPGALGADGTGDGAVSTAEWVGENSEPAAYLFYFLGHQNQVANANALANFPELDSNHRGRGVTYVAAFFHYDVNTEKIWQEKGLPRAIKALIKGRKVYDPRLDSTVIIDSTTSPVTYGSGAHRYSNTSTWEWSDNPALCVADYLNDIMGVDPESSIDWPSIAKAADDCDVVVDVGPAASPTNTQKRFTCNGALSLGESHRSNINRLLSSCDGKLTYTGGVWKLRASVWEASSLSITEDDLAGDVEVRGSAPRSQRFNTIRGYFVDPDRKYEVAEFPHVSSSAYITRDAGETISYDLELPFTNNQYMAQRIAYRLLEQGDNQIICQLTMNARGAKIEIGDMVDVTLSEFSWTNKTFRCVNWSREANGTFKVGLREEESGDYADPLVSEYKDVNSAVATVPSVIVPAPTGLTATQIVNGVRLSWTDPASRLYDRIEIWQSTTDSLATASLLTTVTSSPYTDVVSEAYRKRYYWIRAIRADGSASTYEPNNSPDTGVGAYPLVQQAPISPDPYIRNGSSYWEFFDTAGYVASGGLDSTDAVYVQGDASVGGFAYFAARRGPNIWDVEAPEQFTVEVRWRVKWNSGGVGSGWNGGVGAIVRIEDEDGSNHSTFSAYGNVTFDGQASPNLLGTWFEDSATIRIDDSANGGAGVKRFMRIGVWCPNLGFGPRFYVDYLDASFQSKEFAGAAKVGIVPDPVTEAGKFLKDDGTWDTVPASYPESTEETTAGVSVSDTSIPYGWVTRYGAVGDGETSPGETDNQAAIQDAFDVGATYPTYFPEGIFLCNSNVTMVNGGSIADGPGTLLLGSTAELVVNSNCDIGKLKVKLHSTHRGDWMDVASRSNVTIDGIFFDGNRAAIGALSDTADKSRAHFNTSTNFKVVNSRFTGSNGTILRVEDCDHFNVSDNLFDDSPGLTANGGNTTQTNAAVYTQRCDNFVISDNQVDFIDDNAFALIGPRYATVTGNSVMDCRLLCAVHDDAAQNCKKVSITGNVAIGCENGILIGWFDSPTNYPCQDVVIDGNYLHTGTTDRGTAWTKKYGIIYYNTATNIVISDNVIESRLSCIAASTSEYANLPTDSVTKILYSGNKLTCAIDDDSYPNCVITDDGAQDCMWIGNHLETAGTTPSGTIRMILGGDNDIFIGNTVIAHSGYNDSLFKAGSVVTNNLFDTKGVVAGNAAYQLLNNVFQNSATINETGTAVTISGNFGGTTVENQIVVDNRKIAIGSGSPESSKSAFIGSLYLNKTGGAGTSLYVKESGTGNTGWVPVLTQHYATTVAETTASVTPTNHEYVPGDVRRYGSVGDGTTDDTTPVTDACKVANVNGGIVTGDKSESYLIKATLELGTGVTLDGLNIIVDGDTFTAAQSPDAIINNETFSTLSAADTDIAIRNCNITLQNNTVAFSPKIIMLGGVKRATVEDNTIIISGAKHSAAIECYKSFQDVTIKNNKIDIQTGNVTGGGIWLTNKTSTDTCNGAWVLHNTIRQDSIDELIAVFPAVGPMEDVHVVENYLERLDQGATTGPIMRAFVGNGLSSPANATAALSRCFLRKNIVRQNRSTNTTSGTVQIGNSPTDTIDPSYIYADDNLITGIFTSSSVALRGLLNSATDTMFIRNNKVIYESGSGTPTGITASDGVIIDGNKVVDFNTGINAFNATNCIVSGGSVGITFRTICDSNEVSGQTARCVSLRTTGSGVYPVISGNTLVPAINADCLQVDTSTGSATMEYADIHGNLFDGSATGIQAIVKSGSQTITETRIRDNTYISITGANLWPSTIDAIVDIDGYSGTPEGSINASIGSRCTRSDGSSNTTLYIKESGTGNTGWVAESQTPWTSDIDGGGFGLDNIDRLEIQAPAIPGDTATFTHDGTDFTTTFANTADWNISNLTAGVRFGNNVQLMADDGIVGAPGIAFNGHEDTGLYVASGLLAMAVDATNIYAASSTLHTFQVDVDIDNGSNLRLFDSTDTDSADFNHDGTDFNTAFTTTTDWNITGLTGIADLDAPISSPYFHIEPVTATNIADITHAVNTDAGKIAGAMIWDSTNSKIKIATGSADASTWVDADGTNAVTPA